MIFGFQDDGRLRDKQDFSALDQGRAIGGRQLRLIISRERVQRGNGGYDFSVYDNIVNQARQRGIHPQIVLDNHTAYSGGMGDPNKYAAFVKAAGVHFKGRVGTYSLINEPDLKMAPQKYRQLFVRGQKALNGVDPQARVLFGELSNHNPIGYAAKVAGKRGLTASGFAIHPYQSSNPQAHDASAEGGIGSMNSLIAAMHKLNLKTKAGKRLRMYITEFGYQNSGAPGTVSPEQAAKWWPLALQKARRAGVKEFIAYSLTGSPQNPKWDTGLLNPNGSPRPAYNTLRNLRSTNGR